MASNEYSFSGDPTKRTEADPEDIDLTHDSPHHTIGLGPLQAAAGNHNHGDKYLEPTDIVAGSNITIHVDANGKVTINGATPGQPISDHGGLSGLADDDHPHYLNQARADGRYSQTSHGHSGYAATGHGHDYAATNHGNHPSTPNGVGIRIERHGPISLNAGNEMTFNIAKASNEMVFYSLQHSSTYIFANLFNYGSTSATIKVRNSTSSTNHTDIYVHVLYVKTG